MESSACEPVCDESAFDLGIYATINNGFETLQVSASYPVEAQSGAFCAIEYDSDAKPLLGVTETENLPRQLRLEILETHL